MYLWLSSHGRELEDLHADGAQGVLAGKLVVLLSV